MNQSMLRLQYNQVILNKQATVIGVLSYLGNDIVFIPTNRTHVFTHEQLTAIAELIQSTDTLWNPING